MSKPRRYWAIKWSYYGFTDNGWRLGVMYGFPSRAAREIWLTDGNPYRDSGYREAIPARDRDLRARLRRDPIEDDNGVLRV
jgi:hypothetical protein